MISDLYPKILSESSLIGDDGEEIFQSDDGTTRKIFNYPDTIYTLNLVFGGLTFSEKEFLISFYESNKTMDTSIAFDGDTYLGLLSIPEIKKETPYFYKASITLIGLKQ